MDIAKSHFESNAPTARLLEIWDYLENNAKAVGRGIQDRNTIPPEDIKAAVKCELWESMIPHSSSGRCQGRRQF